MRFLIYSIKDIVDANVLNENLKNYFVGKIKSLENELGEYKDGTQKSSKLNQIVNTVRGRSFPEVQNSPLDADVIAQVIRLAMIPINDDKDEVNYILVRKRITILLILYINFDKRMYFL